MFSPECVTLLDVVLGGGVARHEREQAAGRVAGGVRDPFQGVAHDDQGAGHRGHCHLCQGYGQENILTMIVSSLWKV